ncbi:GNAT family N-acetyltransferase [Allosalinactinospora lopnorensis]|uniref:GNAT family N-acetyltransferase n=1 Tax=Allosalinactinospora lopnorensis TaxID=1352348 RepID=UPI000623E41E|nr:GNAT family N-acetyltransferase [Allosalinactinospora lopnorensis]
MTTITIRTAEAPDLPQVRTALSTAFFDDPVLRWAVPDDDRYRTVGPGLFGLYVEAFHRFREIRTTADGAGAALWAPPGEEAVGDDEAEAFGHRVATVAGPDSVRCFELDALMAERHPREPHWYLMVLGVVPAYQGLGIGSALMAPVLERCDRDGAPAYLEATTARSRALYERHGFRTIGEITLPGGPSLWPMWRAPAMARV